MSAEAIAKVVRDIREGRWVLPSEAPGKEFPVFESTPTVDITAIYNDFVSGDKPHMLYEDSIGRPPWTHANLGYVNEHGNVHMMTYVSVDREVDYSEDSRWIREFGALRWATDNDIDWDAIRWISLVAFWVGGRGDNGTRPLPTTGPFLFVFIAVYDDGEIADIHWMGERWADFQGQLSILLQAITILNCRNVEVMEPVSRPRHERRRIARTGVTVTEIHVTRIGKYRRHDGPRRIGDGVPLGTVRGHLARYGPKHGRGLLFGKYEGEFWIPAHLRGSAEIGETLHDYVVGE